MLSGFYAVYKWCLLLLASVSAGIIFCILALILIDVSMRTLGGQPPRFTSGLVEYGLLYATMFAAPLLLHKSGHVAVTSFISLMPNGMRHIVVRGSLLVCVIAGSIFTYYAFKLLLSELVYGAADIRSIRIPRYVLYAPLPLGFGLMTIEFVIRLFGGYGVNANEADSIGEGL